MQMRRREDIVNGARLHGGSSLSNIDGYACGYLTVMNVFFFEIGLNMTLPE